MHLGDVTREYSPKLTVEHNGFVNGTAALSYVTENYPDAAQVVVVGKTNGAPSTAASRPICSATPRSPVLGDETGHIPDDPDCQKCRVG